MSIAFGFFGHAALAETWTCTYPGFTAERQVIVPFVVEGDKLIDAKWGVPLMSRRMLK
jgi:hypothetical protein